MAVYNVTADADTFTCNAYLAVGDDRTTLVDAGAMAGVADVIREYTAQLDAVLLTHQDADHVGALEEVMETFDADCYAYADHPFRTHALKDGDTVRIGEEACEVVFTPGHTPDHVSFVSDTSLFSGDVVVHNDSAFDYGSFGKTNRPQSDREVLIESIQRLLERMPDSVEHLYAGHGDVFHGDVRDVVATALRRAEKREPKYPE